MQSHHKVVVTPDQETTTGGTKKICLQNICVNYTNIFILLLLFSRIDQMEMRGLHL